MTGQALVSGDSCFVLRRWQMLQYRLALEDAGFPAQVIRKGRKKILAIRWYGGKYSHVDWIVPLLPPARHYCEPFGGSAAILLNKPPSPVETYNDIDGDLVNFFRVLRDQPEEFIEKLLLTPFSREEFALAWEKRGDKSLPPVERARLFFIRAEQVRIGLAQKATPGRWAWCLHTSRRGMAGSVSRWLSRIESLWLVAQRLRTVQIEHDDAFRVIERYDSPETLFYVDPPYLHESRTDPNAYGFEMSEEDHRRLAELLHTVKGKVALSGYQSPLMDALYADWWRVDAPVRTIHSSKAKRRESLWLNYAPHEVDRHDLVLHQLEERGFVFVPPRNA